MRRALISAFNPAIIWNLLEHQFFVFNSERISAHLLMHYIIVSLSFCLILGSFCVTDDTVGVAL
jgi:hypothetical protein